MKDALRAARRWYRAAARLRRGERRGHRARALRNAAQHAIIWRTRRWRIRRSHPGRPIVLVVLTEHMGDIVAAEPITRELRRTQPDAVIVRVVREAYRELVDHDPNVDATWTVGCATEWGHVRRIPGFDRVVNLHLRHHSCATCREPIGREDGSAEVDVGNYYDHGSLLEIFCKAAELPLPRDRAPRVHIPAPAADHMATLKLPPRFVSVHCTSNQDVRDWSDKKWAALARAVTAAGLPVLEIGLHPVVGDRVAGCIDLCGRLSILETAEVIRRSAAFVGIDSGPAHLANATGTPGVVLLGHYLHYKRYMPYSGGYGDGSNAEVIQWDGPAADIPVAVALRALARFMPEVRTLTAEAETASEAHVP